MVIQASQYLNLTYCCAKHEIFRSPHPSIHHIACFSSYTAIGLFFHLFFFQLTGPPLSRTSSHRIKHISSPGSMTSPSKSDANSGDDTTAVNQPVKVEVPAFDEESLNMFFGDHSKLHAPDSKVTIDHFDDLFINSEEMYANAFFILYIFFRCL